MFDKSIFSCSYNEHAKKTITNRLVNNEYVIADFLEDYLDSDEIHNHKKAKVLFYDLANSINEVIFVLGINAFDKIKPQLSIITNRFDSVFKYDELGFGLQNIRYLNSRAFMSLLLLDGNEMYFFEKSSVVFYKIIDLIVDGDAKNVFSRYGQYRDEFLLLWSMEFIRCLFLGKYKVIMRVFSEIDEVVGVGSSKGIDHSLLLFCKEFAMQKEKNYTSEVHMRFFKLNKYWCKCLSLKNYWGIDSYFIYLIRYLYVQDILNVDATVENITSL